MQPTPELFLEKMTHPGPQEIVVEGRLLRRGSLVRLRPGRSGDILDTALVGRVAVVEGIDEDDEGIFHVAVVLVEDPGRDLGVTRHPAHRFFFAPSEVEPIDGDAELLPRRVLVAGIGNVFFGDDGFGVAVARRLLNFPLPAGIDVADFGIRGIDLAYALSGYDAAILVDAIPRGHAPGTLHLVEPLEEEIEARAVDSHRMDPVAVLGLAQRLGPLPPRLLLLGCEPQQLEGADAGMSMELSPPVAEAVERAAEMALDWAGRLKEPCGSGDSYFTRKENGI